ncbi:hypothetical protein DM01DRAFT_1381857 [Hesseltinella vesiculosa]|uniref:Uncharacterized protein n=1 Tax=Hesseltinella vesiculosa TaxID=101127 RepID=A0A1X2GP34_9FUNG|nr:hypothetical protein DM01DRAFT_1381857 [Hesseltinella vesiculosa]
MKLALVSALLATAIASASAADNTGGIYIYVNSIPHPRSSFVKKGSANEIVTDGAACKGNQTLPVKGQKGALTGVFTPIDNQWGFNSGHQNEIRMGYIKVQGTNNCLSLTNGNPMTAEACPSYTEQIKEGNKFAWFHDIRNSAYWAYAGDAAGDENNGIGFDATNLQTKGKTLSGVNMHDNPLDNVFLGLGYIALGHTGKGPTGCA